MSFCRLTLSLSLSLAFLACTREGQNPVEPPADKPPTVGPHSIQRDSGQVRVSIDVVGDAKLGSDEYTLHFDGESLSVPVDSGAVVETAAGMHWIDFGYPEDRTWCSVIGSGLQGVDVRKGELVNVVFKTDCPSLDGKGTLVLRTEDYTAQCYDDWPICDLNPRHGTEQPTLNLERINGTPVSVTIKVAMWEDVAIPLDVGTYRITTTMPTCDVYSDGDASVHAGKTVRRGFTIACY